MKRIILFALAALLLTGCRPETVGTGTMASPAPAFFQTPFFTAAASLAPTPAVAEKVPEPSPTPPLPEVKTITVTNNRPFAETAGILVGGSRENTRAWLELLPEPETSMLGARLYLETGNGDAAAFDILYVTACRPYEIILASFADLNGDGTDEVLAQVDHGSTAGDRFGYVLSYDDGAFRPLWALYSSWLTGSLECEARGYIAKQLGVESVIKTYSCLALNMKEADGCYIIEVIFYVSEQERSAEYQYAGEGWRSRIPGEDWQNVSYPIKRLPV